MADRYQLMGDVLEGQMDLDILNVRRTDSGPYCCRVDIDGVFNDKKVIMNLRVVKGERLFNTAHFEGCGPPSLRGGGGSPVTSHQSPE